MKNTLVYVHLTEFEEDDQFIVRVARDLDQFVELLSLGYEFVTDYEGGLKIVRKRK